MFTQPEPKTDFAKLEHAILAFWKEKDVLNKSIKERPADNARTFYDGPITANGEPHYGHLVPFALKDIIPRYWTMKGFRVDRSLGWDCQGIPVEFEVEKELGFTEKKDIVKYGIAKFNQLCRESVLRFRTRLIEAEERIGRLTNDEEEYYTMDPKFIESVWWSLKELYAKGLLYEGFKVVPYSTRAGTSLSHAEVALGGYKPFIDPGITIKFKLVDDPNTSILAWTTTPWTLPTNFGLAVGKDIKYVKVAGNVPGNYYIVAKDRLEAVFGSDPYKIVGELEYTQLLGKKYQPLFDFFANRPNCFQVVEGFHVTTDSGTGVVHLAPYGEEDMEIFQKIGIEPLDVLDEQGDFTDQVPPYAGTNYRDANPEIIKYLKEHDLLFKLEDYEHEMPMCWRTKTPLIYKPITSWYVAISNLRKELLANNDKVTWVPAHFKDGRFGNWLAEIHDWGISRLRYWGTPIPIWKSPTDKVKVIGSYEELEKLSGKKLNDPHRPFVDEITFEFEGETYHRIPDVLDVWYDSGSMPFARFHYPFENKEKFAQKFPAQFIAEGSDQTRGWFYSLMAIATCLFGKTPYQAVVVNGLGLDDKGAKLSKSEKNYEAPEVLLERHGADAMRLTFYSSPISTGEDASVTDRTIRAQVQEVIFPLWNSYSYFTTYANIHSWEPRVELTYNERTNWDDEHPWDHIPFDDIQNELDAWILAKLQDTIGTVTTNLEQYQIPKATRALASFITELSKWYIRRSRDRFVNGEQAALETLYYVLVETAKLLAPFAPFLSETLYQELVNTQLSNQKESIHLCDYPVVDTKFLEEYSQILTEMELVRTICDMGQAIRAQEGIKVRQPLAKLEVVLAKDSEQFLSPWMKDILMSELNVLAVEEVIKLSTGANMKSNASTDDKLQIALDAELTAELTEAGLLREVVRTIQSVRKAAGCQLGDKVVIEYDTPDDALETLIETRKEEIKEAVSATNMTKGGGAEVRKVNDYELRLGVKKDI